MKSQSACQSKKQPKGLLYNDLELASGAQILFESKAYANLELVCPSAHVST